LSNTPDCTAFCNHSTNSSSVMVSSKLGVGILGGVGTRPPLGVEELVPLPGLCFDIILVFT
jgi:hypothetical protein